MSTIHIKQHHDLTHDETKKRLDNLAEYLEGRYEGTYSWHGNSLRFQRTGVSGSIELGTGYIELRVKLGVVLMPKKSVIETLIRRHMPTALEKLAG